MENKEIKRPMRRPSRRKVCNFCVEKSEYIKLLPRRMTGVCARHQRELAVAIKRARQMALIPYVAD